MSVKGTQHTGLPRCVVIGSNRAEVSRVQRSLQSQGLRVEDPSLLHDPRNLRPAPLVYWASPRTLRMSDGLTRDLAAALMTNRPIVTETPVHGISPQLAQGIAGHCAADRLAAHCQGVWQRQWSLWLDADDTLFHDQSLVQGGVRAVGDQLSITRNAMLKRAQQLMNDPALFEATFQPSHSKADIFHLLFDWYEHTHTLPVLGHGLASLFSALSLLTGKIARGTRESENALTEIGRLIEAMHSKEPPLIPGVESSLAALQAGGLALYVVTRGKSSDQMGKVERSGLDAFMREVITVNRKDEGTYRELLRSHGFDSRFTLKAGNSIPSDVTPALAADLAFAVHLPPPVTWQLERRRLRRGLGQLRTAVLLQNGSAHWLPRFQRFASMASLVSGRSFLSRALLSGRPLALPSSESS